MTGARLNYLNIVLMLLAATAALLLPFETFVLAYAILGPLHYFTEILWLRERQFFTTGKRDFVWLAGLCGLVFCWYLLNKAQPALLLHFPDSSWLTQLPEITNHGYGALIFAAFAAALAMILNISVRVKAIIVVASCAVGWFLMHSLHAYLWVALLLPSLIHVFVFTGIFLVNGAFKSDHKSGTTAALVFGLCGLGLLLLNPGALGYQTSTPLFSAWLASEFYPINNTMLSWLGHTGLNFNDLFRSDAGLQVQRFIAFAYLYHYLNWFSKTGIIGWHKVAKPLLYGAIGLWLGTILLWIWNYQYGFIALFLLSMMHVFLEFPLNHKSMLQLGKQLTGKRNQTTPA